MTTRGWVRRPEGSLRGGAGHRAARGRARGRHAHRHHRRQRPIWNLDDRPGFGGWLFHLAGFTGSLPRILTLVELAAIKDKEPLRAQLEAWASNLRLERIPVAHGDTVDRDATGGAAQPAAR